MSAKILASAFAALLLIAAAPCPPAWAQDAQSGAPRAAMVRHVPPRIEITPRLRPLPYRRCIDWYELQNRPSGTVLYPQMRCWWVRG